MLVFTDFYSPLLPFIFYRCQQLGAHKKCYHFTMTNCHRLCCSLDVTCSWSPGNLYVNCNIYTRSSRLSCKFLLWSHKCMIFRVIILQIHLQSVLNTGKDLASGNKVQSLSQSFELNCKVRFEHLLRFFSQNPLPSLDV